MEDKPPFKTLLGHALVKDETGRDLTPDDPLFDIDFRKDKK